MPQQAEHMGLHHGVFGVILMLAVFCGFGHTKETSEDVLLSNTTQLFSNGSGEEPQVLAIQRPCGPEHEGFCFNGECTYSPDFATPVCRCNQMYSGERCEHMLLDTHRFSSPEEVIGISCGVILLLATFICLLYCCFIKRCQKSSPPYKNYGSENSV